MTVNITEGPEAYSQLRDITFLQEWNHLYERCPWATVFQSSGFVATWYSIYREQFSPVILSNFSPDGRLTGLLTLATSTHSNHLVFAGDRYAEYRVWLSDPENGDVFIESAIGKLMNRFPNCSLVFEYLPPHTPLNWTAPNRLMGRYCKLTRHRRPLLRAENAEKFLSHLRRKKQFRNSLNRLKKLGDVHFQRITDPDEFASIFDEIIAYNDFRHGAVHGILGFENDPLKKPFNLALMQVPDLLRVFVLRAGGKIVAVRYAPCQGNVIHLWGEAQSPFCERVSPGMLSILMMSESLVKEGFSTLDLTPGDAPYKERFATDHDEVNVLRVFSSRRVLIRHEILLRLAPLVRRGVRALHIRPGVIKNFLRRMRDIKVASVPRKILWLIRCLFRKIWYRCELRIYSYKVEDVITDEQPHLMSKDSLPDLLAHLRNRPWHRKMFLSTALARLQDGGHVYTYAEHGRLLHYGWVTEHQEEAFQPSVHQTAKFPPGSAVLGYFYTAPEARGRGLYQSSLRQILQDLAAIPGIHKIYILVDANNASSRHVIEKVGFTYEYSLFERKVVSKSKRWSSEANIEPQYE